MYAFHGLQIAPLDEDMFVVSFVLGLSSPLYKVPPHAMKAYGGSGDIALFILQLGIKWR
jgi:hypothetical protein